MGKARKASRRAANPKPSGRKQRARCGDGEATTHKARSRHPQRPACRGPGAPAVRDHPYEGAEHEPPTGAHHREVSEPPTHRPSVGDGLHAYAERTHEEQNPGTNG